MNLQVPQYINHLDHILLNILWIPLYIHHSSRLLDVVSCGGGCKGRAEAKAKPAGSNAFVAGPTTIPASRQTEQTPRNTDLLFWLVV